MGSATREALASVTEEAGRAPVVSIDDARDIFAAGRAIAGSSQLKSALADPVAPIAAKQQLADRVFASLGDTATSLVRLMAAQRWSKSDDILAGIEQAGIQLAARAADGADVAGELVSFGEIVAGSHELEQAVGSTLSRADDKAKVVERLLDGKASPATIAILQHLVRLPRGRRIGQLVRQASDAVASADSRSIATVTSASRLPAEQLERLGAALQVKYGRALQLQSVVDPQVVGGLKVTVAGDVIDGTVRSKFNDLRLQLG